MFAVLACVLASLAGAYEFTYEYKTPWTTLQRLYLSTYLQTRHLVQTHDPYLRPPRTSSALVVIFPHGTRLALDSDVAPVATSPGAASRRTTLMPSLSAIQADAKRLLWQHLKSDDATVHSWLAHWIYGNRSLWQYCRNAWYTSVIVLAQTPPLAVQKHKAEGRRRLLGRVLKGANLLTRSQFHQRAQHHSGVGGRTTHSSSLGE